MKSIILLLSLLILAAYSCAQKSSSDRIRPWKADLSYWQYKGEPVLLLGATDNDNLFQNVNLVSHLDSLRRFGGNYIRNTMSDRDPGDARAFAALPGDKYDLDKWNREYWERFENLLKLTSERDIIVQIEIWDRFDHSREQWLSDPYNPKNNINYTYAEAGLDSVYPLHPGQNKQPFFFSVPGLQNNSVILKYQQNFVKKLLSVSLKYGNVLYCIDNETSGVEEWATYWAGFIKDNSGGREIFITQMWDNWDVKSATHKRTLDHPERYGFIDISQNSQTTGQPNWDIDPRMDLLGGAGENNAFLSAREGESYVIYFTGPTTVTLDLRAYDIPIIIDWIEIEKADWVKSASIAGGRIVELSSEYPGGAFAVLTLQKKRK